MVIYVGQGDPEKSMRLLWTGSVEPENPQVRRGPKAGLTAGSIVAAAIALADEGGIDAVSMRAVGQRLGKTPMALYTYVPSKAELIDLMWDTALGELPDDYDTGEGWRPALRRWAHDLRAFLLRHPWILDVSGARVGMGPNETRNQETSARILAGLGLPGAALMSCIWSVGSFVHGNARPMAETRQAEVVTGVGETEWWLARSRMLEEVAPDYAERFPVLTRMAAEGAFDQVDLEGSYLEAEYDTVFEFGLERMLDGLERFIDAHSTREG
ncbi:TetR/AcrR family transcriptional regulator [Intrasporangium sp.]|uniref:TetR/AcrR family transcriptional regulator n=1 Tax=Intrasporangium sp. TaxID=1925024 RepID=UPI00293AFE58|nr:TetR/AcrR family transcriptional regulator [Intrasporangium sp.]MDV3219872.1 TetR/AcrR family transcriptional regulator [Intrasporangium sp.]